MNLIAKIYCTRKFVQLQGKATLNARYQVKEACDVASAMQPVHIGSFLLKNFLYTIVLASCYKVDSFYDCERLWFALPYEYLELIYTVGFTLTSASLPIYFMIKHPRLRQKAGIIRQKIW
ncbi:hypothetical protein PENTCL1PPCAC_16683, partial [Pristionchus entomophagus]